MLPAKLVSDISLVHFHSQEEAYKIYSETVAF